MIDPLVLEALTQSWGNPNPFNRVIIGPARISPINGWIRWFTSDLRSGKLPNETSFFHVYQTGQINPKLLNLTDAKDRWQLLSDAVNNTDVLTTVYLQNGIVLPLTRTWYRWLDQKNILFAVEINSKIQIDWSTPQVFLRFYKNAYFESAQATITDGLNVQGGLMQTSAQIAQLVQSLRTITQAPGYNHSVVCYVNGWRVNEITALNTQVGDVAEFVYDSSVYKVIDFNVSQLPSFTSTLDNKSKRLLHYNDSGSTQPRLIDYEDNLDLFMFSASTSKGCYVHKNAADTVRQLTFKDYAVVSDYLSAYYSNFQNAQGQINQADLRLRMYVRYSGQGQMPLLEASMSKFLMDLSDAHQVQAMIGPNATLSFWQAANLEKSASMQLLRASRDQITSTLVEQAYGYYRINSVLGTSVHKVGVATLSVPVAFQGTATAYEYDANGVLLGSVVINACLLYTRQNSNCALVEFVEGTGSRQLDEYQGSEPFVLNPAFNYRFYVRAADSAADRTFWHDVTATGHYRIENGTVYWADNTSLTAMDRLIRSDAKFLDYEQTLSLSGGTLIHQINYDRAGSLGAIASPLEVPLGELDVWLNDHPLVRGVDYILKFPTISIINKSFLNTQDGPNSVQRLRVRMQGFCDDQMKVNEVDETGFVYNGVLSANSRHDLHREKVQRIVINGSLKHLDDVGFMEEGEQAQSTGLPIEGKPYEIRDVINRLKSLIVSEPYSLWRKTKQDQLAAEDYVSQRLVDPVETFVSPISQRYELFSPFLSKILNDLQNDYIDLQGFEQPYSDMLVRSLCTQYLYLLALDPISSDNQVDERYCVIHPHPQPQTVALSVLQYAFFERVVSLFAKDKVVYQSSIVLAP